MELQILGSGTSTGVPLPGCSCMVCSSEDPKNKRSRTAAVIRLDDGKNILIDASTDLRWQCLAWKVTRADAVIFTHAHADHILGIDDLRSFNFTQRQPVPCFGTKHALDDIRQVFHYIFRANQNYEGGPLPQLIMHEFEPFQTIQAAGISIQTFLLFHGKTEVTGFRIGSVGYATDCNMIPPQSIEALHGVKTLFLDGLRHEAHRTHFTIEQAIDVAMRIKAEKTYLIHMSHTIDHSTTNAKLPNGIELAYDGLSVPIQYP